MTFAERFSALIELRGISQREVGRRAGLSSGHVSAICRGEKVPTVESAAKLAQVLDVSLDWLMDLPQRTPEVLTAEEQEIVKAFREMDPALHSMALASLRVYPRRQ